jgi:hypothetical protein
MFHLDRVFELLELTQRRRIARVAQALWCCGAVKDFHHGEMAKTLHKGGTGDPLQHHNDHLYVQFIFEPWQQNQQHFPSLDIDTIPRGKPISRMRIACETPTFRPPLSVNTRMHESLSTSPEAL